MSKSSNSNSEKRQGKQNRALSHALSWALRHGAHDLGLNMTSDGYVRLDELLSNPNRRFNGKWSVEDVQQVVETNDKQRFKLESRQLDGSDESVLYIRANQGHSIPGIDPNQLLQPISPEELANLTIIHGTFSDKWENGISTQGLSRMNRNHIHFASGLPHDDQVISGMRKSANVYIYVDGAKCVKEGVEFFQSDNGVLLTAGVDNEGILPVAFFSKVVDSSGKILWTNDDV